MLQFSTWDFLFKADLCEDSRAHRWATFWSVLLGFVTKPFTISKVVNKLFNHIAAVGHICRSEYLAPERRPVFSRSERDVTLERWSVEDCGSKVNHFHDVIFQRKILLRRLLVSAYKHSPLGTLPPLTLNCLHGLLTLNCHCALQYKWQIVQSTDFWLGIALLNMPTQRKSMQNPNARAHLAYRILTFLTSLSSSEATPSNVHSIWQHVMLTIFDHQFFVVVYGACWKNADGINLVRSYS